MVRGQTHWRHAKRRAAQLEGAFRSHREPQENISPEVCKYDRAGFLCQERRGEKLLGSAISATQADKQSSTIDAVLARDTSHILKVALIFAVVDEAYQIERRHLEAALAIVDY